MTWIKLDDKFHRNAKVLAMSDAAHRVYVDALSYCGDVEEPNGYLSEEQARSFLKSRGKPTKVISELVELNAWEAVQGGYLIHDFEKYLPKTSTARVQAWREKKRREAVTETPLQHTRNVSETRRNSSTHARARATTGLETTSTSGGNPIPNPFPNPEPDHGDVVRGLTFQQAAESLVKTVPADITAVCQAFLDLRGWDTFSTLELVKHEQAVAAQMLSLMPRQDLAVWLRDQWPDTGEPPSSLEFFWRRLQDQKHAESKGRPR